MADELSQSGFDETINKLKDEVTASGERIEVGIEDQTIVLERIIGRSVKAMLQGQTEAKVLVEQMATSQQVVVEQAEEEQKQEKKNIVLFTNMKNALGGLLALGKGSKLSATERKREEDRTSNAMLGALTELGAGFKGLKAGLGKVLKLAVNPLGAIGAIVGIAIGTVAGLAVTISKVLNLPGLLRGLFAPFKFLLSPKSKMGKALLKVVTFITRTIGSIVKVFGRVGGFIAKMLPFVDDILRFIKPFVKIGLKLGGLIGKIFVPLTVAISIFKAIFGFVDELKKGGDILDASLRAIGDVLSFLTFGLFNADGLKKFIGEPIREFIEGIKELFTEGFSLKTLKKIFEPFIKFVLAGPNLLVQAVGKLTAFIAKALGFKDFANKLKAFLAEFNLFDFIQETIQSVVDFFVSIPEKVAQLPEILGNIKDSIINSVKAVFNKFIDDPLGTVKEIGVTIVTMFKKITNTLFDFVLGAISEIPGLSKLLPQDLKDSLAARKRIAAIQKELGGATVEEAEAELARRQEMKQLKADLTTNALAVAAAGADADAVAVLIERRKTLMDRLSELDAKTPSLQKGGILTGQTLARVAETEPEAVIPLSRLDDLVVNPAIASALQLATQMQANALLRDKAGKPTVIAPIAAPTVVQSGRQLPIPIVAPLSLRNGENTLRQIMQKDFRGSMPA